MGRNNKEKTWILVEISYASVSTQSKRLTILERIRNIKKQDGANKYIFYFCAAEIGFLGCIEGFRYGQFSVRHIQARPRN